MSDEDFETFLRLKKIPFDELREIINKISYQDALDLAANPVEKEKYLNQYGWKSADFDAAVRGKDYTKR